jgi:nitric oxide reductase subunit C
MKTAVVLLLASVCAGGVVVLQFRAGGAPTAMAAGDAARGAKLYETMPCASCHDITKPWPGGDICPNLGNIASEAIRIIRLREYRGRAKDAAAYIRESIVDPNAYIVPRPNYRQADGQSVMPKNFGETLTPAQLDDLVAFLLTRR